MPATKQPHFKHTPLDNSKEQIRLLEMRSKRSDGLLEFGLLTVDLDSAPSYTALSYEWGPPVTSKEIVVNNVLFVVQSSLHEFLEQIYAYHEDELPTKFWVDAVCINQNDSNNEEKNHQVRLMGRIYSVAVRVLAFLKDAKDCNLATLKMMLHGVDLRLPEATPKGGLSLTETDREQAFAWLNLCKTRPEYTSSRPALDLLGIIVSQSYWGRVWIIQELTLAQDYCVICGDAAENMSRLGTLLTKDELYIAFIVAMVVLESTSKIGLQMRTNKEPHLDEHVILLGRDLKDYQTFYKVGTAMGKFASLGLTIRRGPNQLELESLISGHRYSVCSEYHDHIYGLLGVAKDVALGRGFNVDYNRSIVGLLIDALLFCQSSDSLALATILSQVLNIIPGYANLMGNQSAQQAWSKILLDECGREIYQQYSSSLVTIRAEGPTETVEGQLCCFSLKTQYSYISDPLTLNMEKTMNGFRVAEVEDNTYILHLGSNHPHVSQGLLFAEGVDPYRKSNSKPGIWFMRVKVLDLLMLLYLDCLVTERMVCRPETPRDMTDHLDRAYEKLFGAESHSDFHVGYKP